MPIGKLDIDDQIRQHKMEIHPGYTESKADHNPTAFVKAISYIVYYHLRIIQGYIRIPYTIHG